MAATISVIMLSAISAAVCAPISAPAGPFICAIESVPNPASSKRAQRLACVLLLPSAPIYGRLFLSKMCSAGSSILGSCVSKMAYVSSLSCNSGRTSSGHFGIS